MPLPVTCLAGTKSPGYLRKGMVRLAAQIKGARLVELPDAGHEASWNRDLRGAPGLVADQIRRALRSPA